MIELMEPMIWFMEKKLEQCDTQAAKFLLEISASRLRNTRDSFGSQHNIFEDF